MQVRTRENEKRSQVSDERVSNERENKAKVKPSKTQKIRKRERDASHEREGGRKSEARQSDI